MRKLKDDKKIKWTESYTDKSEYLKKMYNEIVGPNSYWRFEGEQIDGTGEWYVVVSPAGVYGEHERKWFAGIRKLPNKWPAGGKKFDSLVDAFTYARDTWGVPKPKNVPRYSGQDLVGIGRKIDDWKAENEEEEKIKKEDSSKPQMSKSAMAAATQHKGGVTWHISDFTPLRDIYTSDNETEHKIDQVYSKLLTDGVAAALRMGLITGNQNDSYSVYDFPNLPSADRLVAIESERSIGSLLDESEKVSSSVRDITMPPETVIQEPSDFFKGRTLQKGRRMHNNCKFLYGFANYVKNSQPVTAAEAYPGKTVMVTWFPTSGNEAIQLNQNPMVSLFRIGGNGIVHRNIEALPVGGRGLYKVNVPIPQNTEPGYYAVAWDYDFHGREERHVQQLEIKESEKTVGSVMPFGEYDSYESSKFLNDSDYRLVSAALIAYMERKRKLRILESRPEIHDVGQDANTRQSIESRSRFEQALHTVFLKNEREKAEYVVRNHGSFHDSIGSPMPSGETRSQRSARADWVSQVLAAVPDSDFPIVDFLEYSRTESKPRLIRVAPYRPKRNFQVGYELNEDVFSSPVYQQVISELQSDGIQVDVESLEAQIVEVLGIGKRHDSRPDKKRFDADLVRIVRAIPGIDDRSVEILSSTISRLCHGHVMSKSLGSDELIRVRTSSGKKMLLECAGNFYAGTFNVGSDAKKSFLSTLFRQLAGAEDAILLSSDLEAPKVAIAAYLQDNALLPDVLNALRGDDSVPDALTPKQFSDLCRRIVGEEGVNVRSMYPGDIFDIFSNSAPNRVTRDAVEEVLPDRALNIVDPHYDESGRISTIKLYELLADYGRGSNISEWISAAIEEDGGHGSLSMFDQLGVSVKVGTGVDLSGVPITHMSLDTPGEFKILTNLIGNVWNLKESAPSLYKRFLVYNMYPDTLPQASRVRAAEALDDDNFDEFESIVFEYLTSPDGRTETNAGIGSIGIVDRNVPLAYSRRPDVGNTDTFKDIQTRVSDEYFRTIASFRANVDSETEMNLCSKMLYRVNAEAVHGEPISVSPDMLQVTADQSFSGVDLYDESGNRKPVVLVENVGSETGQNVPFDNMVLDIGESKVVSFLGKTNWAKDFKKKFKPYSQGKDLGNQSYSFLKDSMTTYKDKDDSSSSEVPLLKSAFFPATTLEEFLGDVAVGSYGIQSIPCSVGINGPKLNISEDALSESARNKSTRDLANDYLRSRASSLPNNISQILTRSVESSDNVSAGVKSILSMAVDRAKQGLQPVMWWRGQAANDEIDGIDMSLYLDINKGANYFSGSYEYSAQAVPQMAYSAFMAASEKVMSEVVSIISSGESSERNLIVSALNRVNPQIGGTIVDSVSSVETYIGDIANSDEEVAENVDDEMSDVAENATEQVMDTVIPNDTGESTNDNTEAYEDAIDDDFEDELASSLENDITVDEFEPFDEDEFEPFDEDEFELPDEGFDFGEESPGATSSDPHREMFEQEGVSSTESVGFGSFNEEQSEEEIGRTSGSSCTMRKALDSMAQSSLRLAKGGKMGKSVEINRIIKRYLGGVNPMPGA